MVRKGVGARIAWSIESKRIKSDLADVMSGHLLDLHEFDEGESRREAALDAYATARKAGAVTVQRFADVATFAEAVRRTLVHRTAGELLDIIFQDSERKGVYRSTVEAVSECAPKLLGYDGNSVLVATADAGHGVLLDLEEGALGPAVFELESW
ncbi:hypothetical protein [Mitsuaria sp. BK037]|uniref:hypothetical protein n=1 Tax=Mitsuaria sp. BK037 TaxID=2587122 RepID=UPI001614DF0B|nr:hypothetical protein [Mitsuaria sp. BK037]MBB3284579.1 hypothetical protein [Mitsuaria sp. BK037]